MATVEFNQSPPGGTCGAPAKKKKRPRWCTYVIDVDAAKVGIVESRQHVDAEAGRGVAVSVHGARRAALAIAAGAVANVHHTCHQVK